MLSGYDVIRSFKLQNNINSEFQDENKLLGDTKYESDKLVVINETLSQILGMGSQFVAVFLSAYLVIKGSLTLGALMAILQLSGTLTMPIVMILNSIPKINSMKPILKRVDEFINYSDSEHTGSLPPVFNESITLSNLSFAYKEYKNVIENVNLSIKKGKKYAVVGGSGCGKSTLIKLILGYYSKFSGDIQYDNTSIKDIDINSLNEMSSIIHQNVYMFNKSIKENISLYNDFSLTDMNHVLTLSGVEKFINETENGLNTILVENGSNISGGQKQRIAIARALIRKTPLLVLDEGTSAIDSKTAYTIESTLLNIQELTLITITHKMNRELLELYDEIIFMDSGRIVEVDNYDNLINKNKNFQEFYKLKS